MSKEIVLTDNTFDKEINSSELPILVDFWAEWCGPCRYIGPILSEIAVERAGQLRIGKLNVDENQMTAMKYGVSSIPTMILFKGGKIVDRIIGAMPKPMLEQALDNLLV